MNEPAKPLTILIAGLGALGTVFATMLKQGGHRVLALTKERYLDTLKHGTVRVTGIWGKHEAVLDGIQSSVDPFRNETIDLIILTVKSFDTEKTIGQVKPLVAENTLVLIAQNGYGNYETVSREIGKENTVLARVIFGSKLISPGNAEVTVIADEVRIGQPDRAAPEERIREIAAAITKAGIPTSAAKNICEILWDKILYNSALNPLGTILECTYGQLAEHEGARNVMDRIIQEIFPVAKAHAISLNWKSAEEYMHHFYTNLVPPTAKHYPSMYHDMKAGKRLEIDALNGAIVRLGREKGVPVPVNETITNLVEAKEALRQVRA